MRNCFDFFFSFFPNDPSRALRRRAPFAFGLLILALECIGLPTVATAQAGNCAILLEEDDHHIRITVGTNAPSNLLLAANRMLGGNCEREDSILFGVAQTTPTNIGGIPIHASTNNILKFEAIQGQGLCFYAFSQNHQTGQICETDQIPHVIGSMNSSVPTNSAALSGELRKWHKVTLTFDGPSVSESDSTFLNHRLDVTFRHLISGETRIVPGYFAADGDAANSSATSGNKWRVHFSPDITGLWTWEASFRSGANVAVSDNPLQNSTPVSPIDGQAGHFMIAETNKGGRDFRGKGTLEYVGTHYLRHSETGEYFLKGGADSPENFLAFREFDGTYDVGGIIPNFLHDYTPHIQDFRSGDPTWQNEKGRGIIGALNYLASKEMNSVYFLTMNVAGDGQDVWPWTSPNDRRKFDVSKLAQWEIVFEHMTKNGLMLHIVTQETENDQLLNGGNLGIERKLYYRELVARFAHHPVITWNLGEENTNTASQRREFSSFLRKINPYEQPIVSHSYPNEQEIVFPPHLREGTLQGASIQTGTPSQVNSQIIQWRTASADNGVPWVVSSDEIGPASVGAAPDAVSNHALITKEVLWGTLLAGGAGVEWYFGYNHAHSDMNCEDWRSRDRLWDLTKYALEYFRSLPFTTMVPRNGDIVSGAKYAFGDRDRILVGYTDNSQRVRVDIGEGVYEVTWFNPQTGGEPEQGTVPIASGPGTADIGAKPFSGDAVFELRRVDNQARAKIATRERVLYGEHKTRLFGDLSQGDHFHWEHVAGPIAYFTQPGEAVTDIVGAVPGVHTIRVTTLDSTTGQMDSQEIELDVRGTGSPNNMPEISRLVLVNADTNLDIGELTNGMVVDLSHIGTANLNIRAEANSYTESVRFELGGSPFSTESLSPYAMAGDSNGNYNAYNFGLGTQVVSVTPFSEDGASGASGQPFSIPFLITE